MMLLRVVMLVTVAIAAALAACAAPVEPVYAARAGCAMAMVID
jgi:hypothetical protein